MSDTSGLPTGEPTVTLDTERFWSAASEGRLALPRCDRCDTVIWYPRRFCPVCHTNDVSWFDASGRGVVYSFTVVRQAGGPWKESLPYVIAYIELDEGPRVLGNVVGVEVDDVRIGLAVQVVFDRSPSGAGVPRWRVVA